MFDDKRFTALQKRYEEITAQYLTLIEDKRNEAAKTVVSKGCLYNVLPFEAELRGDKLKGKILPEPIIHNDCNIYRLDGQNKVLLVENMSEFLKMPAYFSLYTYHNSYIERIYGDNRKPYRVELAYLKSDIIIEKLCWAKESCNIEIYAYDQSVLKKISLFQRQHKGGHESNFDLEFIYDTKSVLSCIRRLWPSGHTEMTYSTMKINFKAFGQKLFESSEQAVSAFLSEHSGEQFTRFALDCYSGHGYVSLCMDNSTDDNFKESPADWAYCDFASLPLIEFPLDDKQEETLMKTIVKFAGKLKESDCFKPMMANPAFKNLVFNHNETICEL